MKYIDEDKLPVEIKNNELPKEDGKTYHLFYDEKIRTSGGFVDAIFLAGAMLVCFLWGMLAIILRGWYNE